MLFQKLLDELAACSLFSNAARAPNMFIIYAHHNAREGFAYDGHVKYIINWLRKIHAQILSDQSPLPPFENRIEGNNAIRNILSNQLCLLPPQSDDDGMPIATSVDKIIICGSEVLENYCGRASVQSYMRDIANICKTGADQSLSELQSILQARIESESCSEDFHHMFTELAFLAVRKAALPEAHGMVPAMLNQSTADDHPMRYLHFLSNTDVKLKLSLSRGPWKRPLHKLFFKLLEQLFPDDRDFIRPFRECYDSISSTLNLQEESSVPQDTFDAAVNRGITRAHQEYWSLSCTIVRDGKLRAYTGKSDKTLSKVLKTTEFETQRKILKWLSPISAAELHGRFHDMGTSRTDGTCDWIIQDEEFNRWYNCTDSKILFLRGKSK